MKKIIFLIAMLSPIPLFGCSLGFVPTGLVPPKPYLQYWVKEGMTVEERMEDSWGCGAARTVHGATHVIFSDEQEKAERRPGENNDFAARARLSRVWVECMKAKGYHYEDSK